MRSYTGAPSPNEERWQNLPGGRDTQGRPGGKGLGWSSCYCRKLPGLQGSSPYNIFSFLLFSDIVFFYSFCSVFAQMSVCLGSGERATKTIWQQTPSFYFRSFHHLHCHHLEHCHHRFAPPGPLSPPPSSPAAWLLLIPSCTTESTSSATIKKVYK